MMPEFRQISRFSILFFLVSFIGLLLAGNYFFEFRAVQNNALIEHRTQISLNTALVADKFKQSLLHVEVSAEKLASSLSDGSLQYKDINIALQKMIRSDPSYYGGAVAFAEFQFDINTRLYSPYYFRGNGDVLTYVEVSTGYDYTDPTQEWFVKSMATGSRWSEPYFDDSVGDILMTTYSAVFYDPSDRDHKTPKGVVTIDLSMDTIGASMHNQQLGSDGYAELVTSSGKYLYSPNGKRVLKGQNLFDILDWAEEDIVWLQVQIKQEQSGLHEVTTVAGDHFWFSIVPMEGDWFIVATFKKDTQSQYNHDLRQNLFRLIMAGVVGFVALIIGLETQFEKRNSGWYAMVFMMLVFSLAIVFCWSGYSLYPTVEKSNHNPVYDKSAQRNMIRVYGEEAAQNAVAEPIFVATGVYVTSFDLSASNDLVLTGQVWQRIKILDLGTVQPGVRFIGASSTKFTNETIATQGDYLIYRWSFDVSFRYQFDYRYYPFVRDQLQIGLIPTSLDGSVQLIPDVDSYEILAPSYLPAIDPNAFLAGWDIKKSYFEMADLPFSSSFGDYRRLSHFNTQAMYLNVDVTKRYMINFVSHLTPLAIIGIITFITLLISNDDEDRLMLMKTGVGFELGIATSMLFVVAIAHIGVRKSINTQDIFYLEYFYLLLYLDLLWLCTHSILMINNKDFLKRITLNTPAAFIFVPMNFGIIFLVTWFMFN